MRPQRLSPGPVAAIPCPAASRRDRRLRRRPGRAHSMSRTVRAGWRPRSPSAELTRRVREKSGRNFSLLPQFGQVTSSGMSQYDTTPSGGYDLAGTCPEALWRNPAGGRTEYGPPGLDACAVIECDPGAAHTWSYSVACAVVGRRARGRLSSRDKAVRAVVEWLCALQCPGERHAR